MNEDFARTLSLLRQEKGESQRKVAQALGVSQALLSHYENGIREPGLSFVRRACDYYHVSADYMLGRTMNRDGSVIAAGELYDASNEKSSLKGSILATLQKKLIVNTVSVFYDLLGKTGDKQAINAAADYLSVGMYQLLRCYYRASGGKEGFFALEEDAFALDGASVVMKKAELRLIRALREHEDLPELSAEALAENYPGLAQSVNQVMHNGDTEIRAVLEG